MPSKRRAYLTLTPKENERVKVLIAVRGLARPSAVRTAVQEGAPRASVRVRPVTPGVAPEVVRGLVETRDSLQRRVDELANSRDDWRSHALALKKNRDAWVLRARGSPKTRRGRPK
jgi:hypothetical protein